MAASSTKILFIKKVSYYPMVYWVLVLQTPSPPHIYTQPAFLDSAQWP